MANIMPSSTQLFKGREHAVFSGFFFAYFACFGLVLPFLPYWMVSRGLDAQEAALILSSAFISKVFLVWVWAYWLMPLAIKNAGYCCCRCSPF
jgi:hypothetical protein